MISTRLRAVGVAATVYLGAMAAATYACSDNPDTSAVTPEYPHYGLVDGTATVGGRAVHVLARYFVSIPTSYATTSKWPLIFAVAGVGQSVTRTADGDPCEWGILRTDAYCGFSRYMETANRLTFITDRFVAVAIAGFLSPSDDDCVGEAAALQLIIAKYKIDPDKVCIIGQDMGAWRAYNDAWYAPRVPAAMVLMTVNGPASAGNDYSKPVDLSRACSIGGIASRIYFNSNTASNQDKTTLQLSQMVVDSLNRCGGKSALVQKDFGEDHTNNYVFEDKALYDWLLTQTRAPVAVEPRPRGGSSRAVAPTRAASRSYSILGQTVGSRALPAAVSVSVTANGAARVSAQSLRTR